MKSNDRKESCKNEVKEDCHLEKGKNRKRSIQMKISLFFNKKKKAAGKGELREKLHSEGEGHEKEGKSSESKSRDGTIRYKGRTTSARENIEKVFASSDEEDIFHFENNHDRKINEKKNQQIEREIKEYIYEHENPASSKEEREEEERRPRQEKEDKRKIRYLGYKGDELTKMYSEKLNEAEEGEKKCKDNYHVKKKKSGGKNYDYSSEEAGEGSQRERDEYHRKEKYSHRIGISSKKKKYKEYGCEKNKHEKGESNPNDISIDNMNIDDIHADDIRIDDIFSKKETVENGKSKYMDALINSAKRRALEKEILIQKKLKIDTEKEEKVFITKAYKKKMMDRAVIIKDIEEEQKEMENAAKQPNYNLNLFLKNINAPPNYDRSNRKFYRGN
ncbi:conserved Plasmodium protein, unknown function [Plasmodium ovale wallikeri]|uniref:Nuclear speckle splicing regulatory protein 1 N-terminal domain-containing protein n=1 Tax=Plasmodium ovale wallikeri TaxID=864142 RepID=A0A1A8YZB3_PLAOA|nr:conserved Plasmodium protein, unknown function [Plasmodium ovale wallikeri]